MSDQRCGNCRHWLPHRNPETQYPMPSKPGKCGYPIPPWPQLPAAYNSASFGTREPKPEWPRPFAVRESHGTNCKTWSPKKRAKHAHPDLQLTIGDNHA